MMIGHEHLHHDDVPATLAVLADLLDHRSLLPAGYELTEHGAWVSWETLCRSWLSSTEVAAVHIARGCAIAERHGGLPLSVAGAVREAVDELTSWWAVTPSPNSSDQAGADRSTVDAHGFDEPVDFDPYHPAEPPADPDGSGADSHVEQWRAGPAWAHRRPAELPDTPDAGPGLAL